MDFDVVILGSDANAYTLARCYHEQYGRAAHLLAKAPMSFIRYSDIVQVTYEDAIWHEEEFLRALNSLCASLDAERVVAISSNEVYARFLARNRRRIDPRIVFNYPDEELLETLAMKDRFVEAFSASGHLPRSAVIDVDEHLLPDVDFEFPVIVKPSDVIEWNHMDFAGKKKIYKLDSRSELETALSRISGGGYRGRLVLQEYIPGDDSALFDCLVYCDTSSKVRAITFAQIGLQEHSVSMVGNAACLINGFNTNGTADGVVEDFRCFMESIGHRGWAELDIKFDRRDGRYKILEINPRQGRCSYYATACGHNLVKYLVDDLVYGLTPEYCHVTDEVLLSFVPVGIIKKYVVNREFKERALELHSRGDVVKPLAYARDMSLTRRIFLARRALGYYRDYKNGYWKY